MAFLLLGSEDEMDECHGDAFGWNTSDSEWNTSDRENIEVRLLCSELVRPSYL
jgi:hypothetical protein